MRLLRPSAISTRPSVSLTDRGARVAQQRAEGLARARARMPGRDIRLLPACCAYLAGQA